MDDNKIKELLENLSENLKDNKPDEDAENNIKKLTGSLLDISNKAYIEILRSDKFEKAKLEDQINLIRGGLMLAIMQLSMLKKF